MKVAPLPDDTIPYFCWDRRLTVAEIKARLAAASGLERVRWASWIRREAAFEDVWTFLSPEEVRDHLTELRPFLGRKKEFWQYIIETWHELGKP
jgi:hypothetical protein